MWAFLINVTTEIEADILIGLLEQENIPSKKLYPGIGNLKATYGLMNGVEVYVPDNLILRAKDLLGSPLEESPTQESNDEE